MSTIKSEEAYTTQVDCEVFLCKFLEIICSGRQFPRMKLSKHPYMQVGRPLDKWLTFMYSWRKIQRPQNKHGRENGRQEVGEEHGLIIKRAVLESIILSVIPEFINKNFIFT